MPMPAPAGAPSRSKLDIDDEEDGARRVLAKILPARPFSLGGNLVARFPCIQTRDCVWLVGWREQ